MSGSRKAPSFKFTQASLTAGQIPPLARQYEKKYGIKIIINGETDFGKAIINNHESKYGELVRRLTDEETKYAAYFSIFWLHKQTALRVNLDDFHYQHSAFRNNKDKLKALKQEIAPFLEEDQKKFKELNNKELEELAAILKKYPEINKVLTEQIPEGLELIRPLQQDQGLNRPQVADEIKQIQQTLEDDELVGYFFTNEKRKSTAHFEVLILSNDKIVKPAAWDLPFEEVNKETFVSLDCDYIDASIKDFVDNGLLWNGDQDSSTAKRIGTPKPQASHHECGTLGMIYLKELLKNDGEQLNKYRLEIPYYGQYSYGNAFYLFVPSPQILRYSQSNMYNEIIKAMIEKDSNEPVTIQYETNKDAQKQTKQFTILPLRHILEKTKIECEGRPNSEKIKKECDRLLILLPKFREEWLKDYEQMKAKRSAKNDDEGVSRYLSTKHTRLYQKSDKKGR